MSPQEEAAAKTLDRIREVVYRRRVRIRDFFRGFDPLNCGRRSGARWGSELAGLCAPALHVPEYFASELSWRQAFLGSYGKQR